MSDATYVFLALGIGIAAGVGQLGSAAVMSFIFIFISVLMWRCNWGCPEDSAEVGGAKRAVESGAQSRKGVLSVHLNDGSAELTNIESILDIFAKTWALERVEPGEDGGSILRYRVRLRKAMGPDVVVHELLFHGEDLVTDAMFEAI